MTTIDEVAMLHACSAPAGTLGRSVDTLRERLVGRARANGRFGVDDLVIDDGATLVLHGEVNAGTMPHLEAVLDGVISLDPSALTVDLTRTTTVTFEALAAITRRAAQVGSLAVRLPRGLRRALVGLARAAGGEGDVVELAEAIVWRPGG